MSALRASAAGARAVLFIVAWAFVAWGFLAPGISAEQSPAGPTSTVFRPSPRRADALKVLLVTGGHDHDVAFYSVFDGQDDVAVTVDGHPSAFSSAITRGRRADVVVLFDMSRDLPEAQRGHLRAYVESGGPVVSLHHAIAGSPDWAWLHEDVIGAGWLQEAKDGRPASTYKHDEDIAVSVKAKHPVTAGLGESFRIFDETYKGLWLSPRMEVLLTTDHPLSDGPVAWTLPHPKARLVTIQLGHGREAHLNPAYRRLVRNAVWWAADRAPAP